MTELKDMSDIEVVGFKKYQNSMTVKVIQIRKPFKIKVLDRFVVGGVNDWLIENKSSE